METHRGDKVLLSAQDGRRMSHHCKDPCWLRNLSGPGKLKDAIVKGLAKSWPLEHLKTLGKKLCNRTQQYSVEENKTVSTEEHRYCSKGQVWLEGLPRSPSHVNYWILDNRPGISPVKDFPLPGPAPVTLFQPCKRPPRGIRSTDHPLSIGLPRGLVSTCYPIREEPPTHGTGICDLTSWRGMMGI